MAACSCRGARHGVVEGRGLLRNRFVQLFNLHPVIRIITFLVLAAYLAIGQPADLALIALFTLALYALLEKARLPVALGTLRRLRWFFLSILVIYFWFTPGEPLWAGIGEPYASWVPTADGIRLGLIRAAALVLFVLGVTLLLQTTPRDELINGIRWIVRPFSAGRGFHDKLALRIALVLETVPKIQPLVRQALPRRDGSRARPVERFGVAASRLLTLALSEAQQAPCDLIMLPPDRHPPWWQWVCPMVVGGALWFVE